MTQMNENIPYVEQGHKRSVNKNHSKLDYVTIASSNEFKQLLQKKKKFLLLYTLLYMCYSLLLPFLALYTELLNYSVIDEITWAWIYGLSIIPFSLWICNIYVKKAAYFDEIAKEILEKGSIGDGN